MKFLNRLGDTLLGKLAPETEASAQTPRPCLGYCPSGACMNAAREDSPCRDHKYNSRCCFWGGSACPVRYCTAWTYCGLC
ncbi:hypothetical protein ACFVW2_28755 [Streptomyces sp. NPDC058171]